MEFVNKKLMNEKIPIEIISPTLCKELNQFGKFNLKWHDESEESVKEYILWKEAESQRRVFEIEYPPKAVGMLIWGLSKFGTQCQYRIVDNNVECDIECEIHLEDVDEENMILYKKGERHTAEIIEGTNKVRIV